MRKNQAQAPEKPGYVECRNPSCWSWGAAMEADCGMTTCADCGWGLALTTANFVAVPTNEPTWAVADVQEVLTRGRELPQRALAVRLNVQMAGHKNPDVDVSQPCVCLGGKPTFQFGALDVTDEGLCRYCYGQGRIDLKLARTWGNKNG